MIKDRKRRTIRVMIISVITGVIAPISAVSNVHASAITETVHVKDHTGAPLVGAIVEFGYGATSVFDSYTSPAVVQSGSDQVSIALPSDFVSTDKLAMWIEPPAGDTADAFMTARSVGVAIPSGASQGTYLDRTQSETLNVQLQASNVALDPKDSAGNELTLPITFNQPLVWTSGPNANNVTTTTSPLLRTGAFGLHIPSNITQDQLNSRNQVGNDFDLSFFQNASVTDTTNDTSSSWSVFGINLGNPITLTEFDPGTGNVISPQPTPVNGVYSTNNLVSNLRVHSVDPRTNQPLNNHVDDGWASVFKEDSSGNQNDWISSFPIDDAGNSGFYLANGTYLLQISSPNVTGDQVPTFGNTNYSVTVSSSGVTMVKGNFDNPGPSVTAGNDGFFPTTYTVANVVGKIQDSSGSEFNVINNQYICERLQTSDNQGNWNDIWTSQVCGGNSVYAMTIPSPGTYRVAITPNGISGYTTTYSKTIVATQSGSSLALSYDGGATSSLISHNITLDVPNIYLNIIDPSNSTPNTPLTNGGGNFNLVANGQETGYFNFGIDPNNPGVTAKLADGTYHLYISPDQSYTSLAPQTYTVVVNSGVVSVYLGDSASGTPVLPDTNHVFTVAPSIANVNGKFLVGSNPPPNNQNQNVAACVQSLVNGNWQWGTCTGVSSVDGSFALSIRNNGTYRLLFQPNGVPGIANTYSDQFVVSSNGGSISRNGQSGSTLNFGTITATTPTLSVQVTAGGQVQQNAGVEIRQDNQWLEWDNTGSSGLVGIELAAPGTYQFIVHPAVSGPFTTKIYTVVATGTPGNLTVSIAGVSPSGSTYSLPLAAATLSGVVELPDGSKVWNSQVMATDLASNQDLWENSAQTFNDGSWSLSLPAGRYEIRARAPYGVTQFSDSLELGIVTVDDSGNATLSGDLQSGDFAGATTSNLVLKLQNPYWSGKVLDPGVNGGAPTPDSNASVCLNLEQTGFCTNTDANGNWSMSKPLGFTDFDSNSQVQVRPNGTSQYAASDFGGKTAINGSGFLSTGASGINFTLLAPNFVVSLGDAQQIPASNLWVSVSPINGGPQIDGGLTGNDGKANLYVDPTYLTSGVHLFVDVTGNSAISSAYGQLSQTLSAATLSADTANGLVTVPVTLVPPNIRGQLNYANGTPATFTNVDLFNASTQQWITNGFVGSTGSFTLNAAGTGSTATYTLTVRPPNNGSIPAAAHSYTVTVDGNGSITSIIDSLNNSSISPTAGIYTFTLTSPSVTGVVTNKSGSDPILNSWVQPTGPGQEGSNTDSNGRFALALPNGTWQIQANVPNYDSIHAPSEVCNVTVANGATTAATGAGCSLSNGSVSLALENPNLAVTLLDSSGNPIVGGYVSADVQNWHSGSQTDSSGTAHIYVDWDAIKLRNGISSGPVDFHLGFHPSYGSTTSINLDCDSMGGLPSGCPAIQSISGPYSNTSYTVTLPSPNTHLTLLETTTGSVAEPNGWVNLMVFSNGYISGNVGSSGTDVSGQAVFNVANPSDASVKYAVQVNPSWSDTTYAQTLYTNNGAGYSYSQINNATFTLGSPNLTLTSKNKNGSGPNLGGWVCAEYFNGNTGYTTSWITCLGLNQNGQAKVLLPNTSGSSDQQYIRLTFNSGDASYGATTSCTVVVANGVVQPSGLTGSSCQVSGGQITQNLSAGNVQGQVLRQDTTPVVGAIVKAIVHGLSGSAAESTAVMTSTSSDGSFGLQLDSSKTWDIKIIPVHVSGLQDLETATVRANNGSSTGSGVQPPAGGQPALVLAQPLVLAAKP